MPKQKLEKGTENAKAKKLVRSNGYKLPPPVKSGEIFTDVLKKNWIIGKSIGTGGFGEIYTACDNTDKPSSVADSKYVIKIEPHSNGPLFSEMNFYMRAAKKNYIEEWKTAKKLSFLGMPRFIASGSHEYNGEKYRFMVMERFGRDFQKILEENGKILPLKTVYLIALSVLDTLEYIHSKEYVHADIKASNLLLGYGKGKENQVFLVDYGLACKYVIDGKHKEYKENPKRAHDGTPEFTSRDAHIGAFSRRGDLEVLGYNMLQWCCGRLPWESNLGDSEIISQLKSMYMKDVPKLLKDCFKSTKHPEGIEMFLDCVNRLTFYEKPNYDSLKKMLKSAIQKQKFANDGGLEFKTVSPKRGRTKMTEAPKELDVEKSPAVKRRKPFRARNSSPASGDGADSNPDSVILSSITPTPAMLKVMMRRKIKSKPQSNAVQKSRKTSRSPDERNTERPPSSSNVKTRSKTSRSSNS